jgi:hypothetical protein
MPRAATSCLNLRYDSQKHPQRMHLKRNDSQRNDNNLEARFSTSNQCDDP